jgi:hypothetical protein
MIKPIKREKKEKYYLSVDQSAILEKMRLGLMVYFEAINQLETVPTRLMEVGYTVVATDGILAIRNKYQDDSIQIVQHICRWIRTNKLTVVLWWFLGLSAEDLGNIRAQCPHVAFVLYNWDEPYTWWNKSWAPKTKYLDAVVATCESSLSNYRRHGSAALFHALPGTDIHTFQPDEKEPVSETFDMVFVCTNLYSNKQIFPNQLLDRTSFIKKLQREIPHFKLGVFGPPELKTTFPEAYQGYCKYEDLPDVIRSAKVNLCTHVVGNSVGYCNERVSQILCAGGVMFIDQIKGNEDKLKHNENCIVINRHSFVQQMKHVLDDTPLRMRIRQNALQTGKDHFTIHAWAKVMRRALGDIESKALHVQRV